VYKAAIDLDFVDLEVSQVISGTQLPIGTDRFVMHRDFVQCEVKRCGMVP
jgi:hypothetical protein